MFQILAVDRAGEVVVGKAQTQFDEKFLID